MRATWRCFRAHFIFFLSFLDPGCILHPCNKVGVDLTTGGRSHNGLQRRCSVYGILNQCTDQKSLILFSNSFFFAGVSIDGREQWRFGRAMKPRKLDKRPFLLRASQIPSSILYGIAVRCQSIGKKKGTDGEKKEWFSRRGSATTPFQNLISSIFDIEKSWVAFIIISRKAWILLP